MGCLAGGIITGRTLQHTELPSSALSSNRWNAGMVYSAVHNGNNTRGWLNAPARLWNALDARARYDLCRWRSMRVYSIDGWDLQMLGVKNAQPRSHASLVLALYNVRHLLLDASFVVSCATNQPTSTFSHFHFRCAHTRSTPAVVFDAINFCVFLTSGAARGARLRTVRFSYRTPNSALVSPRLRRVFCTLR